MRKIRSLGAAAIAISLSVPLLAQTAAPAPTPAPAPASNSMHLPTPTEIVAAAPTDAWLPIDPDDLLVMTLSPDATGRPRQIVLQLIPAPFAASWTANIRTLARANWWDGLSIVRVQDNYVVQWGDPDGEDAAKAKPLPAGMVATRAEDYMVAGNRLQLANGAASTQSSAVARMLNAQTGASNPQTQAASGGGQWLPDNYAAGAGFYKGWPVATDRRSVWPVHCYGTLGVGRGMAPDAGTGAELYTVIGHAPRPLDANIAVVGRVIEGIENLSSLPRGTGALGFYETPGERVAIQSIRLASTLPAGEQPRFTYLSTEHPVFARYLHARANRQDAFFVRPAGGVDVCNVAIPVRRVRADAAQ